MREAHARSLALCEAELAAEGGGLEHHSPALAQDRPILSRAGLPHDRRRELLARQHAARQRLRERRDHLLQVLARNAEVLDPTLLEEVRVGRERPEIEGQLGPRQEMQRSAHGPGLDQGALAPERALHCGRRELVHARPERQLSRGEHLRVQAADLPGYAQHGAARRAPVQPVPVRPEEGDLFPGDAEVPRSTQAAIRWALHPRQLATVARRAALTMRQVRRPRRTERHGPS